MFLALLSENNILTLTHAVVVPVLAILGALVMILPGINFLGALNSSSISI